MRWCWAAAVVVACVAMGAAQDASHTVDARRMLWPKGQPEFDAWRPYPVRGIADLKLSKRDKADANEDKFGGRTDRPARAATGFFRTEMVDGRWWMIDPLGHLYLHNAVVDLHPGTSAASKAALAAKFGGDPAKWMVETQQFLLNNGIHGAGAWSAANLITASPMQAEHPLAYTINLDIMSAYGKHKGGVHPVPGHEGYPADTIFVFDPEFPAFADKYLSRIDAYKDDPNLVGYFSDNEIPLYRKNLDGFLSLPENDAGHVAAAAWLKEHGGGPVTDDLRVQFLEFEAARYFEIVTAAIRKHDANHMYLGCRYTSKQLEWPELFRVVGKFAGAVSINYYSDWRPSAETMAMWAREAGKPFLITEFYTKGDDSGLPNRTGAGWVVRTQADRGRFYQNFVLALMESGGCVGWHWFKYQDNDPADPKAEASNQDSNKGIVDVRYQPYGELVARMRELNMRMYEAADAVWTPGHLGSKYSF